MRTRYATSLAVVAALTAACGSTVQTTQSTVGLSSSGVASSPGATSGDAGLTVPGAGPSGSAIASGSVGGTTSGTTTSGSAAGAVGTGGGSGPVATTVNNSHNRPGEIAAAAPGITATTINLGFEISTSTAAADRAIGAAGAAPTYNFKDVMNAAIDYANKNGGFAGRKLQGIYYDVNVANPKESEDQAACAKFTEDNKVFAMQGQTDVLRACAEKAGAVSVLSGNDVASTFKKYPHFVDPVSIRLDRMGPVTVGGLAKAGYFTGKLGLVTWDDYNYRYAMTNGYLPALAQRGIKPAAPVEYISVPQQVGAIGDMTAQISNVVTKFRTLGIDHVIIQDGPDGVWAGGGITLEFMNNAKSQRYYPRYGQNIYNIPGSSELPSDQQNHAIAILDDDEIPSHDAGYHMNATREKCFKIEADAGLPVSQSNDNDEGLAAQACDVIFFLQQVINQLPVLSTNAFISQVEKLGTSFKSAYVYGTRLLPRRLDGSDLVRKAEYLSSCQCLKFSGPPYQPD